MLYNKDKLADSYYTIRIIADRINCILSRYDTAEKWMYIELDPIENYKGDGTLIIYEYGIITKKRIDFKQRDNFYQLKNLYDKKAKWNTITIHSDAVDFYTSDIYIQYDLTYNYIVVFKGDDIDKSKKEYRMTSTEVGNILMSYYNVDIKNCKIYRLY